MKKLTIAAFSLILSNSLIAQTVLKLDLSKNISSTESIGDPDSKNPVLHISNMSPKYKYAYSIEEETEAVLPFDESALASDKCTQTTSNIALKKAITALTNAETETQVPELIEELRTQIKALANKPEHNACIKEAEALIRSTVINEPLSFRLNYNQTITLHVYRINEDNDTVTWSKVYKTTKKNRWQVHYGLTYVPGILSDPTHYFSQADTAVASRYTITPENNGTNTLENISPTINFTYPFINRDVAVNPSAFFGFGLNTGLQLSGHAGLGFTIGTNVLIGTGIVVTQKYQLKGQYSSGQVIKENLDFESLHEKAWMPEMFFTIGFRFNSNPFKDKKEEEEKKEDESSD